MAQFVAFAPDVEVNGQTVRAIVEGLKPFEMLALRILSTYGIVDPRPDQWYPQQAWLDAFKHISAKIGASLYKIGQQIPENAEFPPDIDTVEKALASIDVAYYMNHRGGEIGTYGCEKVDEQRIKMVCRNPYPCDFDRGIITAMAVRFAPNNNVKVIHDDSLPCRKKGDDSCTYWVTWHEES
jgi:hypothetical protein